MVISPYKEIAVCIDLYYKVISKNRVFKAGITEVGYKLPNQPERKNKGFVYFPCPFQHEYSHHEVLRIAVKY